MRSHLHGLAMVAGLLSLPSPAAEILLQGHQHMGNNDGRCEFTPDDPVTHDQIRNYPSNFHLSQDAVITGVRLNGALGIDNNLEVRIDGAVVTSSCPGCTSCNLPGTIVCGGDNTCGDVVIDLTPDIPLLMGAHTISVRDANSSGNDFGFSSITLLSDKPSSSVMLNQRRHPGNDTLAPTDNDPDDDDYDINDPGTPYYPDVSEPYPMDIVFNLGQNRRISLIEFHRVRDVDNGLANASKLYLDGIEIGPFPSRPSGFATETFNTNFLALAGNHTLRVTLGVIGGNDVDSFSWDDIIIRTAEVTTAGTPGFFNAVDTGANALNGVLGTKIAGGAPGLDIVAINALQTGIDTGYTGTVEVTLMDATVDATSDAFGCRWNTSTGLTTTLTFTGADQGRKALPGPFFSRAMRFAGLKVRDTTTGATGCSTDKFALRPDRFLVSASHDTESTAGTAAPLNNTGAAGLPRHKAGRPFTLQLTAVDLSGIPLSTYDGTPENTLLGAAITPASVSGAVTIGGSGWTGVGAIRRADDATYSEVGPVTIQATDVTFADVDAGDTSAAQRTITGTVDAGRFIPDHFRVTTGELTPGCGTFSYVGQEFGYPGGTAVTLTAESAANTTTLGYAGTLFRLGTSIPQATFTIYDDPVLAGTPNLTVPAGSHAVNELGGGVATIGLPSISVTRPATASLDPFAAEIGITLPVFTDQDGVAPTVSPIELGTAGAGTGAPFTGGAAALKAMRYGRLHFDPAYGSERAPLNVPLRTEYWDGVTFVPSGADGCTTLQTADLGLTGVVGASPAQAATLNPAGPGPGPWTVQVTPPNVAGEARLALDLSLVGPYPFLRDDTDGDGQYDNDPLGIINYGLFNRSEDNRIYQREVFR